MRKRKGFTLIELLVVIAIIALLLSVLLPSLRKAKQQARKVICSSHLKQWGLVFGMYCQDNKNKFMAGFEGGSSYAVMFENNWIGATRPYYENPDIRLCPNATKPRSDKSGTLINDDPKAAWGLYDTSTSTTEETYLSGSYGINWWINDPGKKEGTLYGVYDVKDFFREMGVKNASQIPMLGDSLFFLARPRDIDTPPARDGMWEWANNGLYRMCTDRHNGQVNHIFMDFSIRSVGLKELWALKWNANFDRNNAFADPRSLQWLQYDWINEVSR